MIFEPTDITGAVIVHLDRHVDERGFFARTWYPDFVPERSEARSAS